MEKRLKKNSKLLFYGLLIVIVLEYLRLGNYITGFNDFKGYTIIPLVVFFFSLISSNGNKSFEVLFKSTNSKLQLIFIGLIFTSIIIYGGATNRLQILSGTIGYYLLFLIIAKQVDTIMKFKRLVITIILCHLVLIYQNIEVISNPYTRSYIQKGASFLGDGNDFALSLCIIIPLCIFLITNERKKKLRYLYLFTLIILILTVIGTQSRGGSLSLFCVLIYIGLKSNKKLKIFKNIVMILLIVALYAPSVYFNRLQHVNNTQEASAQGRIKAWKAAIEMANDYPLYGVGVGSFPYRYAQDYWNMESISYTKTTHSMYFLALGELGYTGLVLLLSILYVNFRLNEKQIRILKIKSQDIKTQELISLIKMSNCSLIAFAVAGAFLSVLYYPHIFILNGIFESVRNLAKNESSL